MYNVTDISKFVRNCKSLISLPDVSKWDTSNVITIKYLFSLLLVEKIPDISNWNTRKVKNMDNLFNDCKSL